MTAWCHLGTNECTSSDISALYISKSTLASKFKSDFGMTDSVYWSSSPYANIDSYAWLLEVNYYVFSTIYERGGMKKMMKQFGIGGGMLHGKSARRKRAALLKGLGAGKQPK